MVRPKAAFRRLRTARNSRRAAKKYTESTLKEACEYLDSHPNEAATDVAAHFGIPLTTLRERHRGIHAPAREAHERQQLLSPDEEIALVDWLEHLSDQVSKQLFFLSQTAVDRGSQGMPVQRSTILEMVKTITERPKPPNKKWINRFLERHPTLTLGKPSGLDPKRAQAFNRPVVEDHFKKLKELITEKNIPWEHVYNMDEKGVQRGGGRRLQNSKYFVPRGRRPRYRLWSSNLELVTIIECVRADGESLQPGFVFEGKEFHRSWFEDVDPRIV